VLEVSKIEAGHVTLVPVDFVLRALLGEALEIVSGAARAKALALRVDVDATVPQRLRADAQKLRQVLINLLGNAVKFTATGGVRLRVSWEPPGASDTGPALCIEVIDTGVGIAQAELAQLGQAFVQAGAGRAAAEGTGLGLAISRGFADLMGGQLTLDSRLGEGTIARLRVPVEISASDRIEAEYAAPAGVRRLAQGQPAWRILAVDDRPESRRLLVRRLQPLGFDVREAADGQQAVDEWRRWKPALVFMDMRMPVMDGREAARRIKADPGGAGTVVVALTASSYEEERDAILACGCDDFLRKPFLEDVLLELIGRHLPVRYEYAAAPAQPRAEAEEDTGEAVLALPAALREMLHDALGRLDVGAIEHTIEAVSRHDARIGRRLAALAAHFDYARLRAMVEPGIARDGAR
jgi:CheY-like chemotaxis protein